MNKELKEIIDNAKKSTLKHDGYDKLIVQDQDGHYLSLIHISEPTRRS